MFVKKENRGKGIAKMILFELETWAKGFGYNKSVLETGNKQFDAIKLYNYLGYNKIVNFGQYIDKSNSVCMIKYLNNNMNN